MHAPENSVFNAVLITSVVIGITLFYFTWMLLRYHRRLRDMYASKVQAEITALEKERARMAADLHDDLGPILLGVRYYLDSIRGLGEEEQAILDKAGEKLEDLISRIQLISNDLLPSSLQRMGLLTALQESFASLSRPAGLSVNLTSDPLPSIPMERTIHIYRMLMELLRNCIRHAHATRFGVELRHRDGIIYIKAEDDGEGFDSKDRENAYAGLGLRNLLSRTELLNGKMFLDSLPGKGTKYTFEIPVQPL